MATIDELRALAREIREERQIGGNTGERVGNTFEKVADLLDSTGGDISDIREAVEQLLQDVGFIPRDISRTATDAVFTNSEGELLFWLRAATDTLAGLITAANNNKLIALPTAEELAQALAAKQNRLTFDPRPIEGSTNPVTSDGINTAIANFVTRSVSDLIYYYTKSETYTKEEVNALVAAIKQFVPVVAQTLPTASADTMYKLYLIPSEDPQESNIKDEYITIDNGASANPRYTWEKIGSVDIDISGKADIGTVPADVTRTQTDATFVNNNNEPLFYLRQATSSLAGLMTSAEHNKLDALPTAQDLNTSLDSIIYDVSAKNPTAGPNNDGKFTLAYILNPSNVNTLIPTAYRKGGMSIKFVLSSDNKYVQYRLMHTLANASTAAADFANTANWQGVDETPTAGSQNLVKSWGTLSEIQSKEIDIMGVVPVDWFVTSGIPYYSSDGTEQTNANRRRTNYIKVKEGDAFSYTMQNTNNVLIIAAFNNGVLDLTHSIAGVGLAANGTYTVPAGITHIQFCNSNNHTPVITKTNSAHLDDTPTQNSGNLVKSGGVYSSINTAKSEVEGELAASIIAEDKQLKNLLHTEYVLIDGGIDTETGNETTNTRYKHTALFPVKDKGYFFVCPVVFSVAYYSAPFIDSEHYIGSSSITEEVPEGSKYCSFIFDTIGFPSFDTLRIFPKEDIDSYLGETCVGISGTYIRNTDYVTLLKHLNFYKYAVKGMYLYGNSVDSSQDYQIKAHSYVASTRTLRIVIYEYANNSSTNIIDKTVVVPEDKYLDTVLTQDAYNLRIIADFNNVGDLTVEYSSNDYFKFNSRVFYPIVNEVELKGDVEGLAEDLSGLSASVDELAENMNNADEILVDTSDTEVIDYTEYYDTENGAEQGRAVLVSTGKEAAGASGTVTPYIPTNGIISIRTLASSSTGGLVFYTGNDESQYATQYISGYGILQANGTNWIDVPSNAKYFRTTAKTSDVSGGTAILDVKKKVTQTLQEFVDNQEKPTPRNTHVLYGYEGFCVGQKNGNIWLPASKILSARNTLTQATLNEDVKQIVSENQMYFNKMRYEVTFEVKDADTYIGIGYYPISPYVYNELRVRNNNGSAVLEVYGGIGDPGDTYESEDFAVAESVVLPYSLTVGNVYTLGMRRFENETYNNTDHVDGAVYYIHSYADDTDADHPTEIFMPRNTGWSTGGIKNKTVAAFKGYQFVSLKLGEVEIANMFVSSPYNPQAKVVILGDSAVDGDTVVSQGGQYLKYACLLQEKIGTDSFVIAAKGGDAVTDSSKPYLNKETSLFYPKYLILEFGGNYTNLDDFTSQMTSFINWLVKIGIEPILVTMPPVSSKVSLMVAENAVVRSLGYRYVDIYKAVTDGNGNWIEGYVLADNTHPTAAGHQAIYEAFVREVPELFAV